MKNSKRNIKNISYCIDINSAYCPCLLADTNHCVFCSHLQGKELCDCNWNGVCILYEKKWQSRPSNSLLSKTIRNEVETIYKVTDIISDNTYELEFDVPLSLAMVLDKPGAFVFLKNTDNPEYYYFPVGIMAVDNNHIRVVIETIGPKSSSIIMNSSNIIKVKGPYFNGVLGQPWIEDITCGKILLIAGGMGQPPALPIVKKLMQNKNEVTALLAPGKVGKIFIHSALEKMGVSIITNDSLRKTGLAKFGELIKNEHTRPDLVVSAGPDEQHYAIINVLHNYNINIPMAATNNAKMCCGEGICGACEKELDNGEKIRACKVQTNFNKFKYD